MEQNNAIKKLEELKANFDKQSKELMDIINKPQIPDSFEQACIQQGTTPEEELWHENPKDKRQRQQNGYAKLCVIRTAINPPGYDPDYSNPDEPKWKCVWEYKAGSGFVFGGSLTSYVCTYANGGPLLDCVDKPTADLFATKFRKEWLEWLEG